MHKQSDEDRTCSSGDMLAEDRQTDRHGHHNTPRLYILRYNYFIQSRFELNLLLHNLQLTTRKDARVVCYAQVQLLQAIFYRS